MSKKTLWVLAIVLAVLSAAVWWNGRRGGAPGGAATAASGRLLPGVDAATVRAVALESAAATTHLAQVDGVWCVAEKDNYPADLRRLRELIQALDDTENAQIADESAERLAEYGLVAEGAEAPLRIALEHAAGTTTLSLGKTRVPRQTEAYWGPPSGRYVRVDDGPVLLLKDDVPGAEADPAQWWDRVLLDIDPADVRQVEIGSADGTFAIERGEDGAFALADAAEDEDVQTAAAERTFAALRGLRAEDILSAEEAADAFADAATYAATTAGATYRIEIGAAQEDRGNGRPVRIEATGAVPAATAKKLAGRAFRIPPYLADALVAQRDTLVRKAEPAPAEPAVEAGAEEAPQPEPPPIPAAAQPGEEAP